MIVAGVDIGSRTAKAVILNDDGIVGTAIIDTILKGEDLAAMVMEKALGEARLRVEDVEWVVTTGYGRFVAKFSNSAVSEISCHVKGIHYYFPSVRTILDIGGQDSKAITFNEKGKITNFVMNDRCAGGQGRFLEVIAEVLEIPFDELGPLSLKAEENLLFSSICVLFTKSLVLRQLREGVSKAELAGGIYRSLAKVASQLVRRISFFPDFTLTGGVAKDIGAVNAIKKELQVEPLVAPDPQIIGALGAALFALGKGRRGTGTVRKNNQ